MKTPNSIVLNGIFDAADIRQTVHEVTKILTFQDKDMEAVDLTELYKLGLKLQLLSKINRGDTYKDRSSDIQSVVYMLYHFLENPKLKLSLCLHEMRELQKVLSKWTTYTEYGDGEWDAEQTDPATIFHAQDIVNIRKAYEKFENVLFAELRRVHIYLIPSKWIYDTNKLLFEGEQFIPEETLAFYSDDLKVELRAFARCFATNSFTAAGFHLYRALEIILREYYKEYVGKLPSIKERNWGRYIKDIDKNGGSATVIKKWIDIKDSQRNEIMHPDLVLEEKQIYEIIADAHRIINGTTDDINKKRNPRSTLIARK